jgi:molybdate transport system substrate-binding protein
MNSRKIMIALFSLLLIPASLPARAEVVTISAAAGMADAVKKLAADFQPQHPGITIQFNLAASGALAKQIEQGAPADIFVSANSEWMDYLVKGQKIDESSIRVIARNMLVFVGGKERPVRSLADLTGLDHIAIGSPQSVPVGQYAEQAMRAAGIYESLLAENKLIMTKDVRQALLYADRGEVAGAFVYRTDALVAEKVVVLFTVPPELYNRIEFLLAQTLAGTKNPAARTVYQYLVSPEALVTIESFGFLPPDRLHNEVH